MAKIVKSRPQTRPERLLGEAKAALGSANEALMERHRHVVDEVQGEWTESIDGFIKRFPDQEAGFLNVKADAQALAYAFYRSTYELSYEQYQQLIALGVTAVRRLYETIEDTTIGAAERKELDTRVQWLMLKLQAEVTDLYSEGKKIAQEFVYAERALSDGNAAKAGHIAEKLKQSIEKLS